MNKSPLPPAVLLAAAMTAQAEESLSPVVVTATRTAQTVDETLASVTVITRDEIERLQPAQLTDLLESRAGINVSNSGPFGKTSSLFLRGTNSDHTLLLVDGVRMGSATLGGASWQFLPPSEIERIEIVRGPRASIYGADAIGGVIQIFTRRGTDGPARFNAHSRIGEYDTREVGAGVAGGTAKTTYSFSAGHQETDGINTRDDAGDDERDGYRNSSASAHLNHALAGDTELFVQALHSRGMTEFDGFEDETEFTHQAFSAGLQGSLGQRWWSKLTVAGSRDENSNFLEGTFTSRFDTRRDQVNWQNEFTLGRSVLLTVGLDWQEERVDSTTDYAQTSRDNRAGYQIIQAELGRHTLQGSLRHDDNEAFGEHTTGQAAWGYAVNDRLRTRLSYSTAFKAPTFNDLFWPGSGNPDLDPETSDTLEAGLHYSRGGLYWDAALFDTDVDDLIAWRDTGGGIWLPVNVERVRIRGMELETGFGGAAWSASAALSLLDAEDRESGNELVRRPRESFRLDLDRTLAAVTLGGSIVARGRSYDDEANNERLAGHALLNLRASWRPADMWTVRATLDNVLDKEYETARGYNQPGRAAYLSVHYQQ